jgi:hypothetical protein
MMEIVVLIEPCAGGGFRAKAGSPLNLSAEATTAEEATRQLSMLFDSLVAGGCQITKLTVANGKAIVPPPLPADNLYQTDWAYRELQEAIAEDRRQEEAANP